LNKLAKKEVEDMATVIRLRKVGKPPKKKFYFRIGVSDERISRDGRGIEEVGYYDPTLDPPKLQIDVERMEHWLKQGARPSVTVWNLYKKYKRNIQSAQTQEGKDA
jgi:small subunit ribosomal protein S16